MEYLLHIVSGFAGGIVGALITYYFIGGGADGEYEEIAEIAEEDLDNWIL